MPRVIHFEVHAGDPERAIQFYSGLFGWKFAKFGEHPYWLITTGAAGTPGIDGGLLPRRGSIDGEAVIAYVCTVDVHDLDATLKAIEAAGGNVVHPKQAIAGVGWLAYAKDSEGNIFGMMQNDASAR
jgi:predicted enzyme related to lactoylglutathione lyase